MADSWVWIFASAVIAILYFLKDKSSGNNTKNRRRPPGPRALPILGHFHLVGKKYPHRNLHSLAQKHGPIMHMNFGAVPNVIVSSPAAAELFLKTHDLVFCDRPHHEGASYVTYGLKEIVFGRYGPYWRDMRKLCITELLSNLKINQFQSTRNAEVSAFVRSIKESAEKGESVDLSKKLGGLTTGITCEMLFGRKITADGEFNGKDFSDILKEMMELMGSFSFGEYFPLILKKLYLHGPSRRLQYLSSVLDVVLEKIIAEHARNKIINQEKKQAVTFVDTMMNILHSGNAGFEFDQTHIKSVLMDMLLAGIDTSSTTVEWGLSELIRHPNVMKKLQKELKEIVGLDQMVQESHLPKLEYLGWVVKETFRLHPPGPLVLHQSLQDCEVDGFFIPKNIRVVINLWSIGRNLDAWPDPNTFMPERFSGSKVDLRGQDFELLPFGSGRRGCPGLQLGLIMVQLMLAQLVHSFDWELPCGALPTELDMTEKSGLVTAKAIPLVAIPKYRLTV